MRKMRYIFYSLKLCLAGFLSVLIIILVCCLPTPPQYKVLSVPYYPQTYNGWCGAACIQMWAYYDNNPATQQEIINLIGPWANPYAIALGVGYFTDSQGYDWDYGPGEEQQDLAIAAQTSSLDNDIPSISIILNGTHAAIVFGWDWDDTLFGPRADHVKVHDPWLGPNDWISVKDWKKDYFTAYLSKHVIIIGHHTFPTEGENGYYDFLEADGYYYGGPRPYLPM